MNRVGATKEVRNEWLLSQTASSFFSEVCNNYWFAVAAAEVLHKVDYWTKYYLQLGMEILTDRRGLSFAHPFHIEDFSFRFSGGVCFKTIISFLPSFLPCMLTYHHHDSRSINLCPPQILSNTSIIIIIIIPNWIFTT